MRERNNFEKKEGRKINCINCNFNIADKNYYFTYHQVEKITQILLVHSHVIISVIICFLLSKVFLHVFRKKISCMSLGKKVERNYTLPEKGHFYRSLSCFCLQKGRMVTYLLTHFYIFVLIFGEFVRVFLFVFCLHIDPSN